jgi:hypothetical protein
MEIIAILFGFFLKKEFEDVDKFYYKLLEKININFENKFSIPSSSIENIKDIPNADELLPILTASTKDIKLTISKKKILITFNEKNKKNVEKCIKDKESIIQELIKLIKENTEIKRIGVVVKVFLEKKEPMKFLKKFINKEISSDKDFKDISLRLNWVGEIDKIKTNELINLNQGNKPSSKKNKKGIIIDFDINNLEERELKKNEVDLFFKKLKNKIVSFVLEEIK